MVSVVDSACVLVGRFDIKHVIDTRSWRPAGVNGGTHCQFTDMPGTLALKIPHQVGEIPPPGKLDVTGKA